MEADLLMVIDHQGSFQRTMEMDFFVIQDNAPMLIGYYRRGVLDSYAAPVNVNAYREPIADGTLSAAGAVLPQGSCAFHLPGRELPAPPRPYDRVHDGENFYTVDGVDNQAAGTRFRLTCIPEVQGA